MTDMDKDPMSKEAETRHTPTPWAVHPLMSLRVVDSRNWTIANTGNDSDLRDQWEANARFIVKAVNAHDDLVEALKEVMEWIGNWSPNFEQDDEWPETKAKVRAALKKAGA